MTLEALHLTIRLSRVLLVGAPVMAILGCASTSVIAPARVASQSEAVFYVIRKDYPPTAWSGDLVVNGAVVATMKDDTYVKVNVPVGRSSIGLKFAPMLGFSNEPFYIDVHPNQTRYLLFTGDVRLADHKPPYLILRWSLHAQELAAAAANPIMEKLATPSE